MEWTEEVSFYHENENQIDNQWRTIRAATYTSTKENELSSVCFRNNNWMTTENGYHLGFRVVLYVK